MRNMTWNCSPAAVEETSLNINGSNHYEENGELPPCQNDGQCVDFELTDVHGETQRGYKCQCPEGFRYY